MDCDPELGCVGHHDGGDDITYGEGRWRRLIGDTKNKILESRRLCVCNLAHFVEALRNFFRATANGIIKPLLSLSYSDLLAKHALYMQSNSTSLLHILHSFRR
jgi:hypothetical protein